MPKTFWQTTAKKGQQTRTKNETLWVLRSGAGRGGAVPAEKSRKSKMGKEKTENVLANWKKYILIA